VVMLSGSGLEKDVEEAYRLGADGYFQKPQSVAALKHVLRVITDYWVTAELPKARLVHGGPVRRKIDEFGVAQDAARGPFGEFDFGSDLGI